MSGRREPEAKLAETGLGCATRGNARAIMCGMFAEKKDDGLADNGKEERARESLCAKREPKEGAER